MTSESLCKTLWLGGDRKGAYSVLDKGAAALLREVGQSSEDERGDAQVFGDLFRPPRFLDFHFDFVEICGDSGALSKAVAALGLSVCAPLDLSASPDFDLKEVKLLDWIIQMIREKRFRSLACEPPCTAFSPAQHPASRSYQQPLGFNRTDPKTLEGTTLALRCLTIMYVAYQCAAPALLEQPRLSKMAWLAAWRWLILLGLEEAVVASCMFGSIHRKEFRFLLSGFDVQAFQVKCLGGHQHVGGLHQEERHLCRGGRKAPCPTG